MIHLSPLRERGDDVLALARHFFNAAAARFVAPARAFSTDAVRVLVSHTWPGNVRELKHSVERAVILSDGEEVSAEDLRGPPLPAEGGTVAALVNGDYKTALENAREVASRQYLEALMRQTRGNVTRAAELAGVERESLHRLLRRHGLDAGAFRE